MKIIIDTTPEQDAALLSARDAAHVGMGGAEPPTVEEFTTKLLVGCIDAQASQIRQANREELKRIIDSADAAKLAEITIAANA